MSTSEMLVTIAGLAAITLITRGFFMLPDRDLPMPGWLREGLRYAPAAALVAVVAPDLLLRGGQFVATWRDARLAGAAVAALWFAWRRDDILGTMLAGTAAMLGAKFVLGW